MRYFPKRLTRSESDGLADRLRSLIDDRGWGLWAAELKSSCEFIGLVGLHQIREEMPFSPGIELGWRLDKRFWRKGYAAEAASACIKYGLLDLKVDELIAYTAIQNIASIGVMKKIGMSNSGITFNHPLVDSQSILRQHCLYSISASRWHDLQGDV